MYIVFFYRLQVISHMLLTWPGECPVSDATALLSELHRLLKDESVLELILALFNYVNTLLSVMFVSRKLCIANVLCTCSHMYLFITTSMKM